VDFAFTPEQRAIREAVLALCAGFDADYWRERDRSATFPEDFHQAVAAAGWLGIAMPQGYGGAGLGMVEAAILMQAISESGAGFSGASAVHMNIFGLNPVVVFGSDEQQRRWLPPLIRGEQKACFAVTEPNAGLDTAKIATSARREGERYVLRGQKIWTSTAQVADKVLAIGPPTD
jgi:acyl-CoA dehydrogenase